MTSQSDETKIAVLGQKVDDLRDDVREVKSLVGEKVATKEYVDDKINPLKKLVYWQLGLVGAVVLALATIVIGLAVNK